MKNAQILHLLKRLLIIFLITLAAIQLYYAIAIHFNGLPFLFSRMCLFFVLATIINTKNKTTWFLGLFLALYGLYDVIIIGYSEFNPALMDFTSPLAVLFRHSGYQFQLVIQAVPVLFFFLMILSFSSTKVRKLYGFQRLKKPTQKSYL